MLLPVQTVFGACQMQQILRARVGIVVGASARRIVGGVGSRDADQHCRRSLPADLSTNLSWTGLWRGRLRRLAVESGVRVAAKLRHQLTGCPRADMKTFT